MTTIPDTEPRLRLGQLIRYGYSGLLLFLLSALVDAAQTKQIVGSLGPVLSPLVALVLGVGVYVLYKELLGELVFYPVRHMLHTLMARLWYRMRHRSWPPTGAVGSVPSLLGGLGVRFGQRQWAYRSLRSTAFTSLAQNQLLDLLHSEIHLIYVSAVELAAAGLYQDSLQRPPASWFCGAAVLLALAFIVDWRMDYHDAAYMRSRRNDLVQPLRELGFGGHHGGV
jgi:hypothetical protein